jgi:hypothetical protein
MMKPLVRENQAAFTCGHDFASVQANDGDVASSTRGQRSILRKKTSGCIFEKHNLIRDDGPYLIEVHDRIEIVDADH